MSRLSYSCGPKRPMVEITLAQALAQTAQRYATREALVSRHQSLRFTWAELDDAVTSVARGLLGLGLRRHDRVGIWSANCAEWILLQYACARAGLVLVNVNPAYRSHELAFVLRKSRMRALFLWAKDGRTDYEQILDQARSTEQALEHVVRLGSPEWDAMLAGGVDLFDQAVLPNDPANIQYTSGTTGSPKGVVLTHRNLVNNALVTGSNVRMTEHDRMCVAVPLYHCGGCVCSALSCVIYGATIIFASASFDAGALLETIEHEKATVLTGVPTMFIAQLQHPDFTRFNMSSLRAALIGGSPCPVELLRRVNQDMHCEEVSVIYGQTEASPVITMHASGDTLEQRGSTVGRPMANTEVKLVNVAGDTVALGEQGELCTRGYHVMAGYDEEPEATRHAIDTEGWLHTGDLAEMRADEHFHIRGRLKDMIIRGGENIYPAEIENFFFAHPKIADVVVVGLPDQKLGEIVAAWVRPKAGETLTSEEVREYARGKIAHFKVPHHVRIVDSFPMTVTGKVQKFRIREIETEALGREAHIAATA
ncbi:MAG TPA: AMP-binding protein [Bryobacteraceae bacterium]|nr:AMP-binding protein [Bryobacteraceae bacterium]